MAVNDVLSVTIMNTGAANAYFGGLSIDGASQTVNWAGGSPPSDGSAKDMYVFTIVKTVLQLIQYLELKLRCLIGG